jgi:hypothetical protein
MKILNYPFLNLDEVTVENTLQRAPHVSIKQVSTN